jgi:hypothetical protein
MTRLTPLHVAAQPSPGEIALLHKLDSIKNSPSVSRHFASLYFRTTSKAVSFFINRSEQEKNFIQRLETKFAIFFFRSAEAYAKRVAIPAEWEAYFADSALSPLQYQLLGINAHINGDIWQALTAEFSLKEIQEGKRAYFEFQKGLKEEYKKFYDQAFSSNAKLRLLQSVTMGLDKTYGQLMMARWRKRQMELAELYYTDPDKFQKKLGKLHQKMEHINHMILQHL